MANRKILWLIFIASLLTMCLGYYFRPVVTAFGVGMRTGRAEYLQGEDPMLIIRNRGPNTVTFGYYYWLQRYQGGEWAAVTAEVRVDEAGPKLEPVSEPEEVVQWIGATLSHRFIGGPETSGLRRVSNTE